MDFKPKVGDIVALRSHPYNNVTTNILISGDSQLLSPLMVVVETVHDTKKAFDEKTGEETSNPSFAQCKCVWYSHKTGQFEEAWIHSRLLKYISDGPSSSQSFTVGNLVSFSTLDIELGKKRSSLTYDLADTASIKSKSTITALLSFVSPIMEIIQLIDVKMADVKEPLYDSKTGEQKRYFSNKLIKCKWFNPNSDKISEKILPASCLKLVAEIDEREFERIENAISNGKKYLRGIVGTSETIISPKSISYRCGKYLLQGYDYLMNKNVEIDFHKMQTLSVVDKFYVSAGPKFNFSASGSGGYSIITDLTEIINNASSNKSFLRLKYKNRNDKMSLRTLKDYVIKENEDEPGKPIKYVTGFCLLRNDERTFRLDRILNVQELDLKYI